MEVSCVLAGANDPLGIIFIFFGSFQMHAHLNQTLQASEYENRNKIPTDSTAMFLWFGLICAVQQ